jgi:hypothetical protein
LRTTNLVVVGGPWSAQRGDNHTQTTHNPTDHKKKEEEVSHS